MFHHLPAEIRQQKGVHETEHFTQVRKDAFDVIILIIIQDGPPQRGNTLTHTHTHLFLSSESTTTCLFFCGGGDSRVWRMADTFSLVVTLVTVAVTEWVNSDCWATLTADESCHAHTHTHTHTHAHTRK